MTADRHSSDDASSDAQTTPSTARGLRVRRLNPAQIERVSAVLARAHHADPFAVLLFPDDGKRRELLPWHFGMMALYGALFGEVYTTECCEGAAIWLPKGEGKPRPDRLHYGGALDGPEALGQAAYQRLAQATEHLDRLRRRVMPPHHWQLAAIGVDPGRQRRGIGSALLAPVLTRADAESVPCYLETFQQRTLEFFRRHGFSLVVTDVVPESQLRFWALRRRPRARRG